MLLPTLLAAITSVVGIGRKNFWLDESYSFVAAHRSIGDLLHVIAHDESNMAPYYLALHFWLPVGRSEGLLRLLSVPAAVATVPVAMALGRRLFDSRVGHAVGYVCAVNVMVVQYAQEARAYSLVLFLTTASTLLFVDAVLTPRRATRWCWAAVSALACYTHYFAALVVLTQIISLPLLPNWRQRARPFVAAAVALAVLDAPLVIFIMRRGAGPLASAHGASPLDPARLLYRFSGSIPLTVVAIALLAFAMRSTVAVLREPGRSERAWKEGFTWAWLLLPPTLALGASAFHPLWKERYLIVSLPAFLLLVTRGAISLPGRQLRRGTIGLAVVLTLLALVANYSPRLKQGADWRAATMYTQQHVKPGDGFWFLPGNAYVPFVYYAWRRSVSAPPDVTLAPTGLRGRLHPAQLPRNTLGQRLRSYHRIWVVFETTSAAPATIAGQVAMISRALGGQFVRVLTRHFGPLLIVRCYRRA